MYENPLPGPARRPEKVRNEKVIILALIIIMIIGLIFTCNLPALLGSFEPTIDPSTQIPDPYLGNKDALVKIIEYGDYACLTCREWHKSDILERIFEKYGDKIVFVWRDYPHISSFSTRAAEAAQCANDQGRFWEYHDYLYENLQGFYEKDLISYARTLRLDWERLGGCVINREFREKVQSNRQQGYADKVQTAPTFFVNGKRIVGPASFEELSRAIDSALETELSN